MAAKHFLNDPEHLVLSALHSVTLTNPHTVLDRDNKIIHINPGSIKPQVSLVSGGGSGHEPSFAAFVGPGLLSGAVAGTIFASPSAEQIRRCIFNRVDSSKGVLVIIMNYTGDVLNFGMAVEKAKAAGLQVEMLVVEDDAGVGRQQGGKVGRRGIAGTVFVHKIAGALAASGAHLADVHRVAKAVADNTVSIGASLSHVHVPGRSEAEQEDELGHGEVEIGMGIHNEAGSERRKTSSLKETVSVMLKHMLDQSDQDRAFFKASASDECVLLINNLGGVSVLELGGITTEVVNQLQSSYSLKPVRILAGTFMTSLNGLGFSISLLKLTDTGLNVSMLDLFDAQAEAAGWNAPIKASSWTSQKNAATKTSQDSSSTAKPSQIVLDRSHATKALEIGLAAVIEAEPDITKYDTAVGDGDCGIGLKRGAEAILKHLKQDSEQQDVALFLDGIIDVVENTMDGTSGALYAIFLNALAQGVRTQATAERQNVSPQMWSRSLATAMETLSRYTPAQPGDRTLVDALAPFVNELQDSGDVQKAADAAVQGADETKGMKASLGRTVYIGGESYSEVPDPGAYGLAKFLQGLAKGLK